MKIYIAEFTQREMERRERKGRRRGGRRKRVRGREGEGEGKRERELQDNCPSEGHDPHWTIVCFFANCL